MTTEEILMLLNLIAVVVFGVINSMKRKQPPPAQVNG